MRKGKALRLAGFIGATCASVALIATARQLRIPGIVILAQLLGEVVMPVDQWRRLEDSVDPRLDLGVDGLSESGAGNHRQCSADHEKMFHHHGQGLGTAVRARNRRGTCASAREPQSMFADEPLARS